MKKIIISSMAFLLLACTGKASPESLKDSINKCIGINQKLRKIETDIVVNAKIKYSDYSLKKIRKLSKLGIIKLDSFENGVYRAEVMPKFKNNIIGSVPNRVGPGNDIAIKITDLKASEVINPKYTEASGSRKTVVVDAVLIPVDPSITLSPETKSFRLTSNDNDEYKLCE